MEERSARQDVLARHNLHHAQQELVLKQPNTEQTVEHTDDQQNTGNHKKPGAPDAQGADKFGGTRAGAENVEPTGGENSGSKK